MKTHPRVSLPRGISKAALSRVSAQVARLSLKLIPLLALRRLAWRKIIRPYIAWRPLEFKAKSKYGATLNLSLSDMVQRYIFFFGCWEPETSNYIANSLSSDDIFVDIGANIGYYSLLASRKVGDCGKVYAIEASPSIFQKLRNNIELNGTNNIVALNCAVCDRRRTVSVFLHAADNIGATTIIPEIGRERQAAIEACVEGHPLGEIVPPDDLQRARMIKIDVEGAEWLVLAGMREFLHRLSDRTEILIETNAAALSACGASVSALVELLAQARFHPYVIEYDEDSYLRFRCDAIKAWTGGTFEQEDLLFRRLSPPVS